MFVSAQGVYALLGRNFFKDLKNLPPMHPKIAIMLIVTVIALIAFNELVLDKKPAAKTDAAIVKKVESRADKDGVTIGGAFELLDQNGKTFTDKDMMGKYALVYFGFTHCPMICPTALSSLSLALNEMGDKAKEFNIILITTDPERDTVERLKEYLSSFSAPIIGLTGTKEQLAVAVAAYRVYYEKLPADATGNYDMNHSSIVYVMDREGKFIAHFNHENSAESIAATLKELN